MYRLTTLPRTVLSARAPLRSLATSTVRFANEQKPATSQGHATDKAHQTGHRDGDVQSASVRAGQDAKAKSGGSGADEPFDAARQGSAGGSAKSSQTKKQVEAEGGDSGHTGAFQDQVGGQDDASPGVQAGKTESVPGASMPSTIKETVKNTVSAGFDGLKQLRDEKKNFHTSTRAFLPQSDGDAPSRDIPGSRKPVERSLEGEQNQHLKHKSAEKPDSGKGNAADEPHLPSHNKSSGAGSQQGQKKSLHTSAVSRATSPPSGDAKAHTPEGTEAGHNVPPEGGPKLESPYGSDALNPVQPGETPSSQVDYSSTAVDPPNETLRAAAKDGTLGERNPQPQSEFGRIGLDDAWKERK